MRRLADEGLVIERIPSSSLGRLVAVTALAAACLPRGEPPAGRQLIADRNVTLAGVVRDNGDGMVRALFARPSPDQPPPDAFAPKPWDLYVASVDAAGATPPTERLLATVEQFNPECSHGSFDCFAIDGRGRLYVTTGVDPSTGVQMLARVDPITGDRFDVPPGIQFLSSPSGDRLLVVGGWPHSEATIFEADDRAVSLGMAISTQFVGEVLYYLTADQALMRIAPGAAPELLATGVQGFSPQTTPGDLLLMLTRPGADPPSADSTVPSTYSVFDAVTLEETPCPLATARVTLSPDGQWLFGSDYSSPEAILVNRTTGQQDVFDLPSQFGSGFEWRPGHDELWMQASSYDQPTLWIKRPGEPPVELPGLAEGLSDDPIHGASMFTRDGAYWFSSRARSWEKPMPQVGSADDPEGPRFDLTPYPAAVVPQYWRLPDGRLLIPAAANGWDRADTYSVDPATGEARLLGEAGMVLSVGKTRLLENLHINDEMGDLTAVELDTGRHTMLASEFTVGAFADGPGDDRVAPGAHVVYQFQARFESPYDGLWLVTVP